MTSYDNWLLNEADKHCLGCIPRVVNSGWEYEGPEEPPSHWVEYNCEMCEDIKCEYWIEHNSKERMAQIIAEKEANNEVY